MKTIVLVIHCYCKYIHMSICGMYLCVQVFREARGHDPIKVLLQIDGCELPHMGIEFRSSLSSTCS